MVQLPIGPAYGLVVHKVQALTMAGKVLGCLEGVFAHGQVYVLVSRVTDPRNFCLIGLPPADLLDDVAAAWAAHGLDVDACLATAADVTGDWEYTPAGAPAAATRNVRRRLTRREEVERRVPVRLRTLAEVLDPQPETAAVLHRLLGWIDRADRAAQAGEPKPASTTPEGEAIFPEDDEEWWLTRFERRKKNAAEEEPSSSDPESEHGDQEDAEEEEDEDSTDTDGAGEDSDEELGPAPETDGHRDEAADPENEAATGRRDPAGPSLAPGAAALASGTWETRAT